jgi:hypothetical protein
MSFAHLFKTGNDLRHTPQTPILTQERLLAPEFSRIERMSLLVKGEVGADHIVRWQLTKSPRFVQLFSLAA